MNKIPWSITILLIVIGPFFGFYIQSLKLPDAEMVKTIIMTFTCLGALISATWVISGFIQTNKAFILNQRPQLLIRVENLKVLKEKNSEILVPFTRIHYENITTNQFANLNINILIKVNHNHTNLNVFTPNMVMVGRDMRQRNLNILKETGKVGLDLNGLTKIGKEAVLQISYKHSYLGNLEEVTVQPYRWLPDREEWEII